MKKLKFFVLFIASFFFSDIYSEPIYPCSDDIVIVRDQYNPKCPFQPVQAVWLDDQTYGSPLDHQYIPQSNPLAFDCTRLKMIDGKPTLLFGMFESSSDNRDIIKITIANYLPAPRVLKGKFTIEEEGEKFITYTNVFTVVAGLPATPCNIGRGTNVDIIAPLPDPQFFKFQGPGIKHIKFELVDAGGGFIPDSDRNDQIIRLKCDVRKSKQMDVKVVPFIFFDKRNSYKGPPNLFDLNGGWIQDIKTKMEYVYDVLPVPEHQPISNWVNFDGVTMDIGLDDRIPINSVWWNNPSIYSPSRKNKIRGEVLTKLADLTNFIPGSATRWLFMIDEAAGGGFLEQDVYGIAAKSNGRSQNIIARWSPIHGGSILAHELSHTFGMRSGTVLEEYESFPPDGRVAFGYSVKTRLYKNNSPNFPVRCYMGRYGSVFWKSWIDKDDYKLLLDEFIKPNFPDPEIVSIGGSILRNNTTTLKPFYKYFSDKIDVDPLVTDGQYLIRLKNNSNQIIQQYGVSMEFSLNSDSILFPNTADFRLNFLSRPDIKKIEICDRLGVTLAARTVSNNSPTIDVLFPASGQVTGDDSIYIGWNSSDPDGDILYHAILLSNDNGTSWRPVAMDLQGNSYNHRAIFPLGSNYKFKIYTTDGYNTSVDSTDGTFTISSTPDFVSIPSQYPNLTAAFNAINSGTHGHGNISVRINGSFTQTTPATLNGGVFTSLNIMPTTNAIITSGNINDMIILNGADNVTIDGRIGGTGTDNNLTFRNSSTFGSTIKIQNGATNNVVRYCNLNMPISSPSIVSWGLIVFIAQSAAGTGGNNDNTIEYCVINGGARGLYTNGTAGASGFTNIRTNFKNNKVKNFKSIGIQIGLQTVDNNVMQNELFNDTAVTPDLTPGIPVYSINNWGLGTTNISKNYIHDITYTGSNVISIHGVYSDPQQSTVPGTPNTSTVNVINNIIALGGNTRFSYFGIISHRGQIPYTANIYYNSVRIFGNSDATVIQTSMGIAEYTLTTGSTYNLYNNLVRNDRTGGGPGTFHYGIVINLFSGTLNADYNTISSTDPAKGVNAIFGPIIYSSIKKYKDAIANHNLNNNNLNPDNSELHSSFQPAPFISNTDLHLNSSAVGGDMNAKPFPLIAADDFDNQMRSSTFTYRGADHISVPMKLLNLTFALEAITNPPVSKGDYIILQLINSSTCAVVATASTILPPFPGNTAVFAFGNLISNGTQYYLRVIHRNSLPLWSATTQSFASDNLSYDFTHASNKAFGVNAMKLVGTEWSMNSGNATWDIGGTTQDGIIDASDLSLIDNDAFNSVSGYVDTDLTGDNYVDASDLAFVDNNIGLIEQAPCVLTHPEQIELKDEVESKNINSLMEQY